MDIVSEVTSLSFPGSSGTLLAILVYRQVALDVPSFEASNSIYVDSFISVVAAQAGSSPRKGTGSDSGRSSSFLAKLVTLIETLSSFDVVRWQLKQFPVKRRRELFITDEAANSVRLKKSQK